MPRSSIIPSVCRITREPRLRVTVTTLEQVLNTDCDMTPRTCHDSSLLPQTSDTHSDNYIASGLDPKHRVGARGTSWILSDDLHTYHLADARQMPGDYKTFGP
jgi:hypothetical protein